MAEADNAPLGEPSHIPSIAFITLTNNGYIDYTLNCLKSLEKINSSVLPICYCVGEYAHKTLQDKGYKSVLLPNDSSNDSSEFQSFRQGNWAKITIKKFDIIYTNLVNHEYVLFTDGDIVYENIEFIEFIKNNIGYNDILIQNDTEKDNSNKELCSGFMYIKSNPTTLKLFHPSSVIKYINNPKWDDQVYINSIKHKLKFSKLPLDLFPNGQYYYKNSDKLTPMIVHFNWVIGHVKKAKMQEYGKWYLEDTCTPIPAKD
jgi:hypothetical protein